jgi:hypothetical protein
MKTMGAFKLLILLLTLGLEVVAQNVTTPTIQEITAQLEAYVQEQNATLRARQLSGCSLAVRNWPVLIQPEGTG